jgi:hypothetical protein
MKPILITTPRSGSSIINIQISNLAEQWWGYKNCLHEYFSLGITRSRIEKINDKLIFTFEGYTDDTWCNDHSAERIRRRDLLEEKSEYMIKLLPGNFEAWTVDWVKDNWNPIFLERRNKLDQLLSYFALRSTRVSHYKKDSTKTVDKIEYKREWADTFIEGMNRYYQIKSELKGPTLYYEDWIDEGADQNAIIKLLNWPKKDFVLMEPISKPTPYANIPEYLISNKDEWNMDKSVIISRLDGCQ